VFAHVVLFRPRPHLDPADVARLVDEFTRRVGEIPSVRRTRVGRRALIGAAYEQLPQPDLSHVAILEFDDRAGLQAYLTAPAHDEIGRRFWEVSEEQLVYDFEL
jgi:hypothetical protein